MASQDFSTQILDLLYSGQYDMAALVSKIDSIDLKAIDQWIYDKLYNGSIKYNDMSGFNNKLTDTKTLLKGNILNLFLDKTMTSVYTQLIPISEKCHIETGWGKAFTIVDGESVFSDGILKFTFKINEETFDVKMNGVQIQSTDAENNPQEIQTLINRTELVLPLLKFFRDNDLIQMVLDSDEVLTIEYQTIQKTLLLIDKVSKHFQEKYYEIYDRVRKQKFIETLKNSPNGVTFGTVRALINSTQIIYVEIRSINWETEKVRVEYLKGKKTSYGNYYDKKWVSYNNKDIHGLYKLINHLVEI